MGSLKQIAGVEEYLYNLQINVFSSLWIYLCDFKFADLLWISPTHHHPHEFLLKSLVLEYLSGCAPKMYVECVHISAHIDAGMKYYSADNHWSNKSSPKSMHFCLKGNRKGHVTFNSWFTFVSLPHRKWRQTKTTIECTCVAIFSLLNRKWKGSRVLQQLISLLHRKWRQK